MAYNYVTVTGSFPAQSGTVTFTPPEVTDLTGTIPVLGPGALTYSLSGGSFTTAPLLATDNLGLLPPAWDWQVTVALTGQRAYTYPVLVPFAGGSTAALSSLPVSAAGGAGTVGDVTSVTAADTSIVVSGTAAAPAIATGTLDVIAADHPPVAPVGMNGQRLSSLAAGTVATDAVNRAAMLAAAQSGGMTALGYVGATVSVAYGALPVAPVTRWVAGALYGQLMFVTPGVTVNGYVTIAPWGGGTLGGTYVGLYTSAGAQIGVTADLSGSATAGRGIRVPVPGFTSTPADGKIYMLYTNGTLATNAGPYTLPGQSNQFGYPLPPAANVSVAGFLSSGGTVMPASLAFGANGVPSGFVGSSPIFYQALLD